MANLADRHATNIAGRFYVDSSCIDCDQCRTEGPEFFARDEDTGFSRVYRQPATEDEIEKVREIADACPTGSIGDDGA